MSITGGLSDEGHQSQGILMSIVGAFRIVLAVAATIRVTHRRLRRWLQHPRGHQAVSQPPEQLAGDGRPLVAPHGVADLIWNRTVVGVSLR